jgi:hypothetical protein
MLSVWFNGRYPSIVWKSLLSVIHLASPCLFCISAQIAALLDFQPEKLARLMKAGDALTFLSVLSM